MELSIPALFLLTSLQIHLPPNLLSSVCWVESKHVATAIHKDDGNSDSLGICQIKYKTAKEMGFKGRAKDLFNARINIQFAAKFLSFQMKRYHGNINKALVAYNRGNAKGLQRSAYSDKVTNQWRSFNVTKENCRNRCCQSR